MPDLKDKEEELEFIAFMNSSPIQYHISKNPETPLKKYYKIANKIEELSDSDIKNVMSKANALKTSGKCKIGKFLFLKVNPISLSDLANKK